MAAAVAPPRTGRERATSAVGSRLALALALEWNGSVVDATVAARFETHKRRALELAADGATRAVSIDYR
ncbi:hypothetical protein E2L06_06985 [Haloterrigena sp. H1]|uniref:hypothetical protein n=1 Tax=Haloterrigena sp. H1 TaxID=2552943 RepID=UPI00110EFEFF|nr:hypothetical protein [Haloterrigena sp. H1]TMT86355.1 hypothetical protein E2L06_06985 [Haloterrigena sp. H1]